MYRHLGFAMNQHIKTAQQRTAPRQDNASVHHISHQLGRGLFNGNFERVNDLADAFT